MTRNMYIAIAVLLLLFAGCGFFIILLQKDELHKDVQYFLVRHKLQKYINYESVSVTLSDIARINGVRIKDSPTLDFPNETDSVTVRAYAEQASIPSHLSLALRGVRFSLRDVVRNLGDDETLTEDFTSFNPVSDLFARPLHAFLLAGCDRVNADADLRYSYFPSSRKLGIQLDIRDKCLGRWSLSVSFGSITNAQQGRLMIGLQKFLTKGYPAFEISEFLNGAVVTELTFSYTETRLVKGYKKFVDMLYLRLPGRPSPAEPDHAGMREIVTYLSFSSPHRQRNADMARTIADFIRAPDKITFRSRPGKQAVLNSLPGESYRRLIEMLMRLDMSVTLQSSAFEL